MTADEVRHVLLLRAVESPLTPPWREADVAWADAEAAREVGEQAEPGRLLVARAALGTRLLGEREPALRALLQATAPRTWLGGLLIAAAFGLGLLADAVGAGQRINLLAPPLLGLMAWNLTVYIALALAALRRLGRRDEAAAAPIAGQLLPRLAAAGWQRAAASLRRLGKPLQQAGARFVADWATAARPLLAARGAALLHAAAAALVLGVVASLYLRGIAFEYRAGWDSTFLSAGAAHALLQAVLGPASALSGIALPSADQLEALRFSNGAGENAARWIHLHALTAALVVLLPRALLALAAAWRARRLTTRLALPLTDPYFRRIARAHRGGALRVAVLPYSTNPSGAAREALQVLVARSFGARAALTVTAPVALAGEDKLPPLPAADAHYALFALAATPERENHGAFIEALRHAAAPSSGSQGAGSRIAGAPAAAAHAVGMLVDDGGFSARFGDTRSSERRRAWQQLASQVGITAQFIDLATPGSDMLLSAPGEEAT